MTNILNKKPLGILSDVGKATLKLLKELTILSEKTIKQSSLTRRSDIIVEIKKIKFLEDINKPFIYRLFPITEK